MLYLKYSKGEMNKMALTEKALEMQRYPEGTRETIIEIKRSKGIETWYRVKYNGLYYTQRWLNGECIGIFED